MSKSSDNRFYAYDIPRKVFEKLSDDYGNKKSNSRKEMEGSGGKIEMQVIDWNAHIVWGKRSVGSNSMLKGIICLHTLESGATSFYFLPKKFLKIGKIDLRDVLKESLIRIFWLNSIKKSKVNKVHILFPCGKMEINPDTIHIIMSAINIASNALTDHRFKELEGSTKMNNLREGK